MTPVEYIDLVTPEADRKPRARRIPLPSLAAAAATLSFDLTADTPSPVSARGIADDVNDRRGGDARDGSDRRPPDIPCHLPGMNEYARSNTSHDSHQSPHRSPSRRGLRVGRNRDHCFPDTAARRTRLTDLP